MTEIGEIATDEPAVCIWYAAEKLWNFHCPW